MNIARLMNLGEFTPRNMCFAEADAGDQGSRPEAVTEPEPEPEIDLDPEPEGNSEDEDLEEIEYEGRKAKIPKAWKDPLEQGKDYRYKTGKLAERARAVEADAARYTALIKQAEETLKANQPSRPDEAMLDRMSDKYDPDAYHLQRARWEGWAQKLYGTEQERKRLESENQTKAERERAERKTTAEQALVKEIPKWRDSAARAADRAKTEQYLAKRFGITAEEAGEMDADHRLNVLAYESMLYREAVAKATARKDDAVQVPDTKPAPVRRVGGGGGPAGGIPKSTDAYIKWRQNGGKM